MARPTLTCSILALCLLAGLPAQAQPGPRDDRGRGPEAQRPMPNEPRGGAGRADGRPGRDDARSGSRSQGRDDGRHDGRKEGRNEGRYGPRYDGRYDGRYGAERGAGPDHNFRRGDRLPWAYRQRSYVVDDWRGHRLSAPPRGYHWVQTGGDYVLVAIATGVILQLLLMGN